MLNPGWKQCIFIDKLKVAGFRIAVYTSWG